MRPYATPLIRRYRPAFMPSIPPSTRRSARFLKRRPAACLAALYSYLGYGCDLGHRRYRDAFLRIFCYFHLKNRLKTAVLFRDNLYQSEAVTSPFVLGFIRPRIYLPFTLVEKDLDAVVAHEKAHIARGDVLWKLLGYLFLCVYWFNPLVWLAYILFCRDIEFACDERVIGQLAAEERAAYSEALLAASMPKARIAACPLAFGEGNVKERIKRVLSYKKPAFWVILIAVLACAALAVCFLTDPVGFTVKNPAVGEYVPGGEGMQGNVDTDYFTSVSPDFADRSRCRRKSGL